MKRIFLLAFLLTAFFMVPAAGAATATFDDLTLAPNSYWNGSDGSAMFTSGDTLFTNGFTDWGGGFTSWDGWAYSNMTDTTTSGFLNQYSSITGSGSNGSANYGVMYDGGAYGAAVKPLVTFGAVTGEDYNSTISGAYFTNTTYAYLSMRDGDGYVNAFAQNDWQMMTIKGIDENGDLTANGVDFILADFRGTDVNQHYMVDQWTWVDLSSLGNVVGLEFSFSGSQVGNVPKYVAMDDLNGASPVPVPAAFWLLGSGLLGIAGFSRRRA